MRVVRADDAGLSISFPLSPRISPEPRNDVAVGDGIGDGPFPPLVMEVGVWGRGSRALEPAGASRNIDSPIPRLVLHRRNIHKLGRRRRPREVELLACVACRNAAAVIF